MDKALETMAVAVRRAKVAADAVRYHRVSPQRDQIPDFHAKLAGMQEYARRCLGLADEAIAAYQAALKAWVMERVEGETSKA